VKFLRNREIAKLLSVMFVITLAGVLFGYRYGRIKNCIYIVLPCILMGVATVFFTYKRYRDLAVLSEQVDKVLHGDDTVDFDSFKEGELSVLGNALQKTAVRLREQADILKKDKAFLSDSLADIAHQMRTPMTTLSIVTSFLSKPDLSKERKSELYYEAESLIERIDWFLSTLLKISKIDAGTAVFKKESLSVQSLLKKSFSPLEIAMELRDVELRTDCGSELTVNADLNWTSEAIGNILKNCAEHTPNGGQIDIRCKQNAVYTEIRISDNGDGIAENDLPHIFERFYQGSHTKDGSFGIGLALCKMILTAQNATVKAGNNPDGGACFLIRFY